MITTTERCRGTITSFNRFGGLGKIIMMDGREVRVRYSSVRGEGVRCLEKGAAVSFLLEETQRGLYAVCVQPE
ncbi:MAG: cold shock domain-containing protein [Anaerolineae bacterium]|nr:cold shock domain-containing protein [Anaerolineae bacterium]